MYIDFNSFKYDVLGYQVAPTLILKTPHESTVGVLGQYFNLKLTLNYSDLSSGQFDYPAVVNGDDIPFYDDLEPTMVVEIRPVGRFVISDISENNDGVRQVKTCTINSLEYEFSSKRIAFGAGTYRLYNLVDPSTSILGMILERFPHWRVGEVDSDILTKYRTFSDTNDAALSWMRNTGQDSYGCVFDFDTSEHIINIVSQTKDVVMRPIFISFNNLIKEAEVTCSNENYCTSIDVTGADDLDIRNVNPIGENNLYNLSYPIGKERIPAAIAQKWISWQNTVDAQQAYYISLVALRNSAYGRYLTENAKLTDLNGELSSIENRRATAQEALALASTTEEENYFNNRLSQIRAELSTKKSEISVQQDLVDSCLEEYNDFSAEITTLVSSLKKENFFTADELNVLLRYISEESFNDATFATFDTDVSGENDSYANLIDGTVSFTGIRLEDIQMDAATGRRIFSIKGGNITLSGQKTVVLEDGGTKQESYSIAAQLNNATLDRKDGTDVVLSAFLGGGSNNEVSFPSGNITLVGMATFDDDDFLNQFTRIEVPTKDDDGNTVRTDIHYEGNGAFTTVGGSLYFTKNVTEYQKYAVAQELYDYAKECLADIASPTYEFDISSVNIIFAQEFEGFKDALKLGYGVYLKITDKLLLKPRLLSVELDFENPKNFNMTFANSFKMTPRGAQGLGDQLQSTSKISKSLDSDKYKNGAYRTSGSEGVVKKFIQNGIDAATTAVTVTGGQNIKIDETGFTASSETSPYSLRIANGMMALVSNETGEAVQGFGHFYNSVSGTNWTGVNAKVIAGPMIIGENLIIECPNVTGDMMLFSVDSTGVQISNGRMYLDHDRGGKIMIDPTVGFAMGTEDLYTIEDDGTHSFNQDNASFYMGFDGKLYLKDIDATGTIHGSVITGSEIYIGGNNTASNCKFGVDALGNIIGIETMNGALKFDSVGKAYFGNDVEIAGGLTLSGPIQWNSSSFPVQSQFSTAISGPWHDSMQTNDKYRRDKLYDGTWGAAYQFVGTDGSSGSDANVTYGNIKSALQLAANTQTTFITANSAGAPNIYGGNIYGANIYAGTGSDSFASMDEDGFRIYAGGTERPKVSLEQFGSGDLMQLVLGAGSSTTHSGYGRLFLQKAGTSASLIYQGTNGGTRAGFEFQNDGTLNVIGTLTGVTATFG
ncbi:hypothetical protein SDC9_46666 [bioreactor metagenome]|uniref:Prophage tail endopeptidase domain-containing protein n=1 Tax=bioreactor metagenome TaxID=1076179 RepID=A0A644W9M1_9ZZZZ